MPCPAMDTRTLPASRPEPRPEQSKGVYLKRVEYLDGRVREETLAEVHGVKNPFKHYEIWREIAVPGRARKSRAQDSQPAERSPTEIPLPNISPTAAMAPRIPTSAPLSLNQFLRIEAARPQSLGAMPLPPLHLSLAIKESKQLAEVMQTVRIAQQTILNGREVTIDRVFLVSNPQKIDEQRTLLAEIVPTSELIELRKLVAQELTQQESQIQQREANREILGIRLEEAASNPLLVELQTALSHPVAESASMYIEVAQRSRPLDISLADSSPREILNTIAAPMALESPLAKLEFSADALRETLKNEFQNVVDLDIPSSQPVLHSMTTSIDAIPDPLNLDSEPLVIVHPEDIASEPVADSSAISFGSKTLDEHFNEFQNMVELGAPSSQPVLHSMTTSIDAIPELLNLDSEPLVIVHPEDIASDPIADSSAISIEPKTLDELFAAASLPAISREDEHLIIHQSDPDRNQEEHREEVREELLEPEETSAMQDLLLDAIKALRTGRSGEMENHTEEVDTPSAMAA